MSKVLASRSVNFSAIAAAVFFAAAVLANGARLQAQEDAVLKIGVILPLSGPAASHGSAAKNGLELARRDFSELKAFEFMYEDDAYNPSRTVAAFRKLTGIDNVDLVFAAGSTSCNAIAPLAEAQKVPFLAWASDEKTSAGRKFVIRTYATGFSEGKFIAEEALRRRYGSLAVFYSVSDYADSVRRGLLESLPPERVALAEELPQSEDFKPFLLRAKKRGSRAFFICLNPGQSGLFARQLRRLKVEGNIFGCDYLSSLDEHGTSEGALSGAWFVTAAVEEDFHQRYRVEFGSDSAISAAAIHYDVLELIGRTFKRRESGPKIVEMLLQSGPQKGAGLGSWQFVRTADDQFLDMRLAVQTIRGEERL